MDSDLDFSMAARAFGCRDYFMWTIAPEVFGKQLLEATKRYGRFLNDSGLAKSHSDALEKVARAAGLPNWHALHTLTQGLIDDFNPDKHWPRPKGGGARIRPLAAAMLFLTRTSQDCPPTPEERAGLERVAAQLATACECPTATALDILGRMNGADSWEKLLRRTPQEAVGPLYTFSVAEDGEGNFNESAACRALIEQQNALFQDYHSRPKDQQQDFQQLLGDVLGRRPDFLEGLLAKAEVMRYTPQQRHMGKVYSDAIRQADALIPAGFKGKITWYRPSNRFYHRLLYRHMVWRAHKDQHVKAIALARRQLRLNKDDNLGVRMWLPILLSADSQNEAADKACAKMVQDGYTDAGVELVRAICHFVNGRYQQSAESFYLALFVYPPFRHVISVDFDALYESLNADQNLRTRSPDPETMIDQYVSVTACHPSLEESFSKWLKMPGVTAAESLLAAEFQANWRTPDGSIANWDRSVKRIARDLSKAIGVKRADA